MNSLPRIMTPLWRVGSVATIHCCSDQGCRTGDLDGQNTALTVGGMARDLVGWKRHIYELAALDQIQMCEANFGQSANMLPQDS
jgi:hypothetical protein